MSTDLNFKVLTARRGYEYSLDDLRLTMLATEPVVAHIKEAFHFQVNGIVSPPPTFGLVNQTLPPGLVFQMGMWLTEEQQIVPIRFLHVEPTRIVIDTAGTSEIAHMIYEALLDVTSRRIAAPDGSPLIGEPIRVLNFSEISMQIGGYLDKLIAPAAHTLFTHAVQTVSGDADAAFMPTIQFQVAQASAVFDGQVNIGDGHTFSLSVRAGSTPNDHIIYSSAPLETVQHIEFLRSLTEML